jgi:hypothetical protein
VRLLILLALWPSLAFGQTIDEAFPPTIRVAQEMLHGCRITIDRAKLDTTAAPLSWFTIEVSTDRQCGGAELALDLPAGTHVVGMAIHSRGDRTWSAARPVREARESFGGGMGGRSLLVWDSTSGDQDHLRVFVPLPARVELALELPPLPRVVIEAKTRTEIDLRGVASRTTPAPYAHADARTALVAGAPSPRDLVFRHGRWQHTPARWSDKTNIRRAMKLDRARITHCYERIAQWRGEIAGTATLQFFITKDGAVEGVSTIETDLPPSITSCVEQVIGEWKFEGLDAPILVNYPLRFSTPPY